MSSSRQHQTALPVHAEQPMARQPAPGRHTTLWPSRASKRLVCGLLGGAVLLQCGVVTAVVLLWRRCQFPYQMFAAWQPSRLFTDRYGAVLRVELGTDDSWHLPVPLDQISPSAQSAIVAVEDHRFHQHRGIDWFSVVRAAASDIRSRRIVQGASTISMQLVRLANPQRRTWRGKVRQAFGAWDLERRHSKEWILEQYLNRTPYGGNLIGIEAASRAYFAKPAKDLSLREASILAGLPQRPSALRPDRYPARAWGRQKHVLTRMEKCGWIGSDAAAAAAAHPPRCVERSRVVTAPDQGLGRLGFPRSEEHFCRLAARETSDTRVRTCLDPDIQAMARTALRSRIRHMPSVADGAAVVIENVSGAVRALVGTVDFHALPDGQVNAACRPRSSGSVLKPFIYLAAIDQGLILPETQLNDAPLLLGDYRPGNFDGTYRGRISAREALARSLNTPAVRLLAEVGTPQLLARLRDCGITTLRKPAEAYGLSLALGGGEVTLLELTNAYVGIARGGIFMPCRFTESAKHPLDESRHAATRPFTSGSIALVVRMLRTYPLPGCTNTALAWKTGTSNGNSDAWCVAFDRDYTIGVWLGNKSGRAARELVGIEAAAPVVVAIARGLYQTCIPTAPDVAEDALASTDICAQTGLRAGPHCPKTDATFRPTGVPLRCCPVYAHGNEQYLDNERQTAAERNAPVSRIASPEPARYFAPGGVVRLQVAATGDSDCDWFINGRYHGLADKPFWHVFAVGKHMIVCMNRQTGTSDRVSFIVE